MSEIILDKEAATYFQNASDIAQVRDPSGKVLGQFIPIGSSDAWEPAAPDLSEEELQRREQEAESFTTAEVLRHLEQL